MYFQEAVILHKVLTELHTGMLCLAFFGALTCFLIRQNHRWEELGKASDATFLWASTCGIIFLLFSAITGFLAWPWDRLWRTPMVYSKVSFWAFATTCWAILIVARLNYGRNIWSSRSAAVSLLFFSVLGFFSVIMAGSAGGHLGHGASLLDPIFGRFDPYVPMVWPLWWSVGIIVAGSYFALYLYLRKQSQPMTLLARSLIIFLFLGAAGITKLIGRENTTPFTPTGHTHAEPTGRSQPDADSTNKHTEHRHQTPTHPALKPAEGASVKILSPEPGQLFHSDKIPIQFKLIKGKRGHHVHAYVDAELMGMFESDKGTLNGIKPGKHRLELRVVTQDHNTELDATDSVNFTVQ